MMAGAELGIDKFRSLGIESRFEPAAVKDKRSKFFENHGRRPNPNTLER